MPTTIDIDQFKTAADKVNSGLGGLLIDWLLMPLTAWALRARARTRDAYADRGN